LLRLKEALLLGLEKTFLLLLEAGQKLEREVSSEIWFGVIAIVDCEWIGLSGWSFFWGRPVLSSGGCGGLGRPAGRGDFGARTGLDHSVVI
jgi:hypothetical protein